MSIATTSRADASMAGFEATTSRWGRITMLVALLLSLCGPAYLVFFGNLDVTVQQILTAYAAVAGTFLIFALVEPVTYFPILGQAAMYQAFMIGNISNKLLPAAIVAQDRIGVRPGTRKGDLAAVMAICGAAMVHLTSLLIFVGILGTWLLSLIPAEITIVARSYILPAILGAVLVQAIATVKQVRTTVVALAVGGLLVLVCVWVKPLAPYATALGVLFTIVIAWFARNRNQVLPARPAADSEPDQPVKNADTAGIA
ncbi:MAG: hypothetical protein LBE25_02260 [Arthrobacter sp.]|jgi:hypothetical protein|nr:hypothetical protein [Arthrobacter sp.]